MKNTLILEPGCFYVRSFGAHPKDNLYFLCLKKNKFLVLCDDWPKKNEAYKPGQIIFLLLEDLDFVTKLY